MNDYNIEFAHIYVDETIDEGYKKIAQKTREKIKDLEERGKSYCLSVLIDDYNPVVHNLKISEFTDFLKGEGVEPDFVVFESELIKLNKEIFSLLKEGKTKRYYEKYINNKKHFPCSFLIVVWYFLRLGLIDGSKIDFYIYNKEKPFKAGKVINILQSKYNDVEDTALDIIKNSILSERIEDIEHIFVD